jgi:hypothetical protein
MRHIRPHVGAIKTFHVSTDGLSASILPTQRETSIVIRTAQGRSGLPLQFQTMDTQRFRPLEILQILLGPFGNLNKCIGVV